MILEMVVLGTTMKFCLSSGPGASDSDSASVPVCQCACVPVCPSARVPGCQGARVIGRQGARVPECPGARLPECQGARVPGCQSAKVPVPVPVRPRPDGLSQEHHQPRNTIQLVHCLVVSD